MNEELPLDELTEPEGQPKPPRSRRPRAELIDIIFENGVARGWAFDVHEAFRNVLDITWDRRVDEKLTKEARRTNPKAKSVKRKRKLETLGVEAAV